MPSGHVVRPSWPQGASVTAYQLPLENKKQLQTGPFKIESSDVNKEWLLSIAEFQHYLPTLLATDFSDLARFGNSFISKNPKPESIHLFVSPDLV